MAAVHIAPQPAPADPAAVPQTAEDPAVILDLCVGGVTHTAASPPAARTIGLTARRVEGQAAGRVHRAGCQPCGGAVGV